MPSLKLNGADLKFRAASEETRLRILNLLRSGELCVGDIVEILQVPQPTASRHLAYLRRAELVQTTRKGLWSHYGLAPAKTAFHRNLLKCLDNCFAEAEPLRKDEHRLKKLRASGGCCPL